MEQAFFYNSSIWLSKFIRDYPVRSAKFIRRSHRGVFLHPFQPFAHEGVAQRILFNSHEMSGPIENGEGRSGVVVQQVPGVAVSTDVVLSRGQYERRAAKGCGKPVYVEGKGASRLQSLEEGVVG